jgi:hypothetical protein
MQCRDAGEAQAKLYFVDLLELFLGLFRVRQAAVRAILSVAQDYRAEFPRCRLVLRPKKDSSSIEPRGLYWGKILPGDSSAATSDRGKARQIVHHLRGPLRDDWVYQVAKESARIDHFRDFERRREGAHGARHAVVQAIDAMRRTVLLKYPEPTAPLEIPSPCPDEAVRRETFPAVPDHLVPRNFDPKTRKALLSGWRLVYAIALAERELGEIARSIAANPVLGPRFRLQFLDRDERRPFQETRWVDLVSTVAYPVLSDEVMEECRLPSDVRPVLKIKEARRQLLIKFRRGHISVMKSLRELAAGAHLAAGTGLAEASLSSLGAGGIPAPRGRAAG